MTEKTYTIEQIDAAFGRCTDTYVHADTLIAELQRQRPEWDPED